MAIDEKVYVLVNHHYKDSVTLKYIQEDSFVYFGSFEVKNAVYILEQLGNVFCGSFINSSLKGRPLHAFVRPSIHPSIHPNTHSPTPFSIHLHTVNPSIENSVRDVARDPEILFAEKCNRRGRYGCRKAGVKPVSESVSKVSPLNWSAGESVGESVIEAVGQ